MRLLFVSGISALLGSFLFAGQALAGPEIQEREWEITSQMVTAGIAF